MTISVFNLHVQFYYPVGLGLHIVIALLALTEMVAAIVGSAFCCHGICCTSKQTSAAVVSIINDKSLKEFIIICNFFYH